LILSLNLPLLPSLLSNVLNKCFEQKLFEHFFRTKIAAPFQSSRRLDSESNVEINLCALSGQKQEDEKANMSENTLAEKVYFESANMSENFLVVKV
jgi:hypothetical protein